MLVDVRGGVSVNAIVVFLFHGYMCRLTSNVIQHSESLGIMTSRLLSVAMEIMFAIHSFTRRFRSSVVRGCVLHETMLTGLNVATSGLVRSNRKLPGQLSNLM